MFLVDSSVPSRSILCAPMRELLALGLAQYVNVHYRTPQLIGQQLNSVLNNQLKTAPSDAKANASRKGWLAYVIHT